MSKRMGRTIAQATFVPSPPTGLGPRTDNVLLPLGVPPGPLCGPGLYAGELPLNAPPSIQFYQVPAFTNPGLPVAAQLGLQGLSFSTPDPYAQPETVITVDG